jgi:hypothetical protein
MLDQSSNTFRCHCRGYDSAAAVEAPPADRDTPAARRGQPVASDAAA